MEIQYNAAVRRATKNFSFPGKKIPRRGRLGFYRDTVAKLKGLLLFLRKFSRFHVLARRRQTEDTFMEV